MASLDLRSGDVSAALVIVIIAIVVLATSHSYTWSGRDGGRMPHVAFRVAVTCGQGLRVLADPVVFVQTLPPYYAIRQTGVAYACRPTSSVESGLLATPVKTFADW